MKIPYKLEDVYKSEKKKLFTVFSTFAGGGGSSTGYRLAGGHILGINEFIPAACETYALNYPTTKIFPGDIRDLTGAKICEELGIKKGELDLLDGSPPCSAFSMAGQRDKMWGKIKQYSSTTQVVDDLFFEYARILEELQPKVFVAENVEALLFGKAKEILGSLQNGLGLFTEEKKQILPTLQQAGYTVRYKVLDAADYGVPQHRRRTIIIGVRNDIGIIPTFPKKLKTPQITVGDVFKDVPREDDVFQKVNKESKAFYWLTQLGPGGKVSDIHPNKSYFSYCRLSNEKPSPTICQTSTTHYMHPDEERYISINECKRIMGFPDDYQIVGHYNTRWERLGRAVAPPMYYYVGKHIYKNILKKTK